jgi:hypothetical protein
VEWNCSPSFRPSENGEKCFGQYRADLADDLEETRAQESVGTRQGKWPGFLSKYLELLAFHAPWLDSGQVPFSTLPDAMAADLRTGRSTKQMAIFFAVVLTIDCPISTSDNRCVLWSRMLFLFAPASASRMRFTAPDWKHSPDTGDEAMPPASWPVGQ